MKEKSNIQLIREEKGISVADMTRITKISRVSYYRYEQDKRIPDARTAIRIAEALGTSVEALWGGNPTR